MKIHLRLGLLAPAAGLVAVTVLATSSAWASISDTPTQSVTLRYDPRDLNTDKGADHLLSRIGGAASRVCGAGRSPFDVIERSGYRACRQEAIAHAVAIVNRPTVRAAYNRRYVNKERGLHAAAGAEPALALRTVAAG